MPAQICLNVMQVPASSKTATADVLQLVLKHIVLCVVLHPMYKSPNWMHKQPAQ
jgi:hypothetical protein